MPLFSLEKSALEHPLGQLRPGADRCERSPYKKTSMEHRSDRTRRGGS